MNEIIFEEIRCAKCHLKLRDLLDSAFHPGLASVARNNFYSCSKKGTHEFTQISSAKKAVNRSNDPLFLLLVDEIFKLIQNHGWTLTDMVEASTAASIRYQLVSHNRFDEYF